VREKRKAHATDRLAHDLKVNIESIKFMYSIEPIDPMVIMPTTISLDATTRELLRSMGEKGESYDKIIRRLIKDAGWKKLDSRWNKILSDDEFISLDEL
jgi:hypothetical protein